MTKALNTETLIRTPDRSEIDESYCWNLTDIYSSDAEWREAKQRHEQSLAVVNKFRGTVCASASSLLDCLELVSALSKEQLRLQCYSSMRSDEDTRDANALAMDQEIAQVGSDFASKTAFIEPEILQTPWELIEGLISEEPQLLPYQHSLKDTFRRKPHTLSEPEERILAHSSLIADTPNSVYSIFSNAEFPFPEIVLADGKTVRLDKSNFSIYRAARNRNDRKKIFRAYFDKLYEFRRTFGAQLYAEVKKNMFYSRSRGYKSVLQRALDGSNIPEEVYRGLIENVRSHIGTFHRYLDIRRRMMQIDRLHYYDLYAPTVSEVDLKFTFEEARSLTLDSLLPLGGEYCDVAARAFQQRWFDVYPNQGKRSGAYSNGSVYDVHPYMLLNYNGKYEDVSTLTHELGHTMHSYLSNKSQPFVNSHYSIFVAEVASTFNEALLLDHMLQSISDEGVRLSLLMNYLDGARGTVFRQTQFSEFEISIHEAAEKGRSLTGDSLCELYTTLTREYYGHDDVCFVDEETRGEWANIPHFYYNFYVYQYATSFVASSALSELVFAGNKDVLRKYLLLLSAGGSDYPIELLKSTGIDITSSEPFEFAMKKMNRVMDEVEKIIGSRTNG
ncbi:MAG TPA: oligoendopeptidase F [Bacteroidota bacterium]